MIICRAMDCGAVMHADDEETVIARWNTRAPAQAEREPVAWLDVRTAGLGWQNRIIATNPQFVENNGPENFVALYASAVPSTNREAPRGS